MLLFAALGCVEEIDLGQGEAKEQIVVNSLFTANENPIVFVHKTTDVFSTGGFQVPDKAISLELLEDGKLVSQGEPDEQGRCVFVFNPTVERNYEIVVKEATGEVLVSATDRIPSYVNLTKATFSGPSYTDEWGITYYELNVSFNDELGVDNYYEIAFVNDDFKQIQAFSVNHPVFSVDTRNGANSYTMLFCDKLFKDGKVDFRIVIATTTPPNILLYNVSSTYYHYKSSLYVHQTNKNVIYGNDSPLDRIFTLDPFDLYSNVQNGLGVFAAYARSERRADWIR